MIIIRGLNKAFGEKIIFSNFNLEIPDGSFVVISGDSGSGKSTLLNMIGGIEKPDSGSIIIEGLNITRLKNKNSFFADTVGFLFQNFALLENKTVKENLSLIKKSSRTKVSLKEALNRVGLSKEVNKKVYQLSGGEQQRVALARLMMKKCSVVLADEPTGSLDKKNRDFKGRSLCWKASRRYFPRRRKHSAKKKLSVVFMRCSENMGTDFPNHSQHCCPGLLMV